MADITVTQVQFIVNLRDSDPVTVEAYAVDGLGQRHRLATDTGSTKTAQDSLDRQLKKVLLATIDRDNQPDNIGIPMLATPASTKTTTKK